MGVSEGDFGQFEGEIVKKYVINNGNMSITLISYGAAVQSLMVPDRHGHQDDITLGFDSMDGYLGKNPYFGAIVGRVANRIADAKFTLNGKTYQLDQNNGPNGLHGGLKALDKVNWKSSVNPDKENSVAFTHLSPDGDNKYPGDLLINVTYTLTKDNAVKIRYLAMANQATPVNLSNHAYFNLGGHQSGSQSLFEHRVQFNADHVTPVSDKLIPTGAIQAVDGTAFDLRSMEVLGPLIKKTGGYDHNLCLKGFKDLDGSQMILAGRLEHLGTGRALEVTTNQPGIQFYTGNFLPEDASITGKSGVNYQKYGGICLETQIFPDSINQPTFPNVILNPGSVYSHKTDIKFSVI
eukprot:maker-scaffold37_size504123-snap-gene-4.15 protein:Tk07379 transcript:maker-scaffold37_size504123-snap-gene-4.15-mRNA-1 annotation:"aldose 1-epimerase"